jgi:hypothetical protein
MASRCFLEVEKEVLGTGILEFYKSNPEIQPITRK